MQDLSNVYATLEDLEVKGRYAIPLGLCMQTLEKVVRELQQMDVNMQDKTE